MCSKHTVRSNSVVWRWPQPLKFSLRVVDVIREQTWKAIIFDALVIVLPRRTGTRQLTVGSLVEIPYVVEFVYFSFLVAVFVVTACAYFQRYSAPGTKRS